MLTLATSVLLFSLAPAGLEIVGDATCPAPTEVSQRLGELLPATAGWPAGTAPPDGAAPAARVVVMRSATALRLVLLGPNANELATRELALNGSCDDLAAAAAVVVAAWRADLNPDLPPSVKLPAAEVSPPTTLAVVAPPAAPAPPRSFSVGLGVIGSESGGAFAPGVALMGTLALGATAPVALDASVSGTTSRSTDVGSFSGAASWSRATLALGPSLTLRGKTHMRVALHAQLLAALLRVHGVGFADAGSDTTPELGVSGGARLEVLTSDTSALWLGLDVLGWPGQQRLIVQDAAMGKSALSRLEVVGGLGLSLGRFP